MDKHYMKVVLRRRRPAGRPVRRDHRPRSGSSDPARRDGGRRLARLPGVRQAGPGRVEHGHHQGAPARASCDAAVEAAREHDPKVVVEAGDRGPRDRVRRAAGPRRRRPADQRRSARSRSVAGGHEFYDFEAKYLAEDDVAADAARPTCRDDVADEVRDLAAAAFEALGCEGLARVDFFYTDDGEVVVNEINTMPGLHAALDVPADVGGHRPGLPGAGRRADPARAAPAGPGCAEPRG